MSKSKRKTVGIKIYKTYRFSGQDPAVSDVLHAISGDDQATSENSGVAKSTFRSWRQRKTRRPQHATMEAALRANGKRFVIEDI